jgi:hypothetical protein
LPASGIGSQRVAPARTIAPIALVIARKLRLILFY